jgi:hypothetical protein
VFIYCCRYKDGGFWGLALLRGAWIRDHGLHEFANPGNAEVVNRYWKNPITTPALSHLLQDHEHVKRGYDSIFVDVG